MWDDYEQMMADLEDEGCIDRIEVDEFGEKQIYFNWELMDMLHPELSAMIQEDHIKQVDEALSNLVDDGLIEMSFIQNGDELEAVYGITEAGKMYVEQELDNNQ